MKRLRTLQSMQRWALARKSEGRQIAFVPTMGCLHEGHLQLIDVARREVGAEGLVVVSLFVNPIQFNDPSDFQAYPRVASRDRALCRDRGVDAVFEPDSGSFYPDGFSTRVEENRLSLPWEGACRPGHFQGVTTVVAKLFLLSLPDLAIFGEKDWQQAAVIRRMILDLSFPIRMITVPVVREPDGLAMSSRNARLGSAARKKALWLSQLIVEAQRWTASHRTGMVDDLKSHLKESCPAPRGVQPEYVEVIDGKTLEACRAISKGCRLVLAAHVGGVRLIDNGPLL